jgi:hypothetical protein
MMYYSTLRKSELGWRGYRRLALSVLSETLI